MDLPDQPPGRRPGCCGRDPACPGDQGSWRGEARRLPGCPACRGRARLADLRAGRLAGTWADRSRRAPGFGRRHGRAGPLRCPGDADDRADAAHEHLLGAAVQRHQRRHLPRVRRTRRGVLLVGDHAAGCRRFPSDRSRLRAAAGHRADVAAVLPSWRARRTDRSPAAHDGGSAVGRPGFPAHPADWDRRVIPH